ncbi:MAG: hypothetical protein LUE29_11755, partial [Lachnospiraceae bacterium]|nr:hypothetical protein [Lachnospiraceae bacterium]
MEEADLPEESENTNLSEEAEESELTGDSGEAELPKEVGEADPAAESEPEYLPEEVEDTDSQEEIEESGSQEESSEFDLAEESEESDFEQERKEAASDEAETSEAGEIEFVEGENRKSGTEDFLSGVELDLSRLGQEGNPYTQMRNEDEKRETEKMDDVFSVIREMETDLNEEDRIYNAYTEEEPKERRNLDEADRKEFEQYLKITGMETQIAKAISDYVTAYNNDGTSRNPNILITGGAKTGKSQLAVSLIRAINRHLGREGRKTARISGFNLNRKTLSASMPRLLGNDLLIEHAGEINRKIVAELMDILPKYTGGMIVVMEDEKSRLDHLFEDYPLLADYFPNHLDIKEYDINEWAAVAKSYARSQGYTIDELGTLALYAEIDALYGMLQGLEVDDIKDIVDEAIEHSERKMGAALARIFGKKKDTGRKVLRETDFNA